MTGLEWCGLWGRALREVAIDGAGMGRRCREKVPPSLGYGVAG